MNQPSNLPVELSGQENNSLRDYITSHHTTVLTVMFTDIKGYTELTESKGEAYVDAIRKAHDQLLTGIIEHKQAGLVVKHIGDAVMAVFADPSLAVERAVQIQQQLVTFNQQHSEWDDIEVRIGLHMGQVTVEGELTFDIFGRHVNRAARLESLADGGQIYMSYTVFDSARSWLKHHDTLGWQSHGRFGLKGISEPVEVFEVWDTRLRNSAAPRNASALRQRPKFLYLAAAAIAGIALTLGISAFKATELRLKAPYPETLYTDNWQPLTLEGSSADAERRVAHAFSPGEHPLYYLISENTVRHSTVRLQRGDNLLQPEFSNHKLPALYIRQQARAQAEETLREARWQYRAISPQGQLNNYQADARLSITSETGGTADSPFARHRIHWQIRPDGLEPIRGERTLEHPVGKSGATRQQQELGRIGSQTLLLKSTLIGPYIQLRLDLEYRPKTG